MFYQGRDKFKRLDKNNLEKYLKITYVDYQYIQHTKTKKLDIISL